MKLLSEKEYNAVMVSEYGNAVKAAKEAADALGYNIYIIGGAVRDIILSGGEKIKDIDITDEGDAVKLAEKLHNEFGYEIISRQEKLRTAKVKFDNNTVIDFASTRQERYEYEGALPIAYNFGCSLEDDIKRRDFTVNTLAIKLNGENEKYIYDFCSGYEDIKNKQIRILHDKSFKDDPSRIVRAVKFQTRFNFSAEQKTYSLMQEYLNGSQKSGGGKFGRNPEMARDDGAENEFAKIPLERVKNEFKDYFSINKPGLYKKIIDNNVYKLVSDNPLCEIDEQRIEEIKRFNLFSETEIWFIYFVHLIINSSYADGRLNLNGYENKVILQVRNLLNITEKHPCDAILVENNPEISKDNSIKPDEYNDDIKIYNIFKEKEDFAIALYYIISGNSAVKRFCEKLKDIKVLINGNDLISLGYKPSAFFNVIFNKIIEKKIKGEIKTKEEEIKYVKEYKIKEEQN